MPRHSGSVTFRNNRGSLWVGLLLFLGCAPSVALDISRINLKAHVKILSSDAMEGRLTGTRGETLATQYVADRFLQFGLEPAGEHGTFFQEFNFIAAVSLGKNNSFFLACRKGDVRRLKLNQEWRPLAFSENASFADTGLVFAGYGISAPAQGKLQAYDSYRGLDVQGKWVIVFTDAPEKNTATQRQQLSSYASHRHKAFAAREHGAKGIIFVRGHSSKATQELIPLGLDTSLAGSGIIALSVSHQILADLLQRREKSGMSLQQLEEILDSGQLYSFILSERIQINGQTEVTKNIQRGRNVLAKLKLTPAATQMIVVGAHVDHLGRGNRGSSLGHDSETGMIHSGADDNASGVAAVLEAANILSRLKAQGKLHGTKDLLFAAWSGEELGVLGSSHFVTELMKAITDKPLHAALDAAINLDMVGHLREQLVLQGVGSSSDWPKIIRKIKRPMSLSLMMQSDPYLPTDSTPFYLQGVPTLNFFTGAHDAYHTPRDRPATLNYKGIQHISGFLVDLILALERVPRGIDYREVQSSGSTPEREFRIYLGTIPDYAGADVSGVKLSGTAKNSPADQAGMRAGDVIIELAGKKIHNIYDYTFVLNTLPVHEPVRLVVRREHRRLALTIIARYRE